MRQLFTSNRVAAVLISAIAYAFMAGPASAQLTKKNPTTVPSAIDRTALHAGDQATVAVIVNIKAGLHAQSNTPVDDTSIAFSTTVDKNSGTAIGTIQYPKPEMVKYAAGTYSVFRGWTVIRIPITVNADSKPGPLTIFGTVRFQTCNEDSCYAPETHPFSVTAQIVAADQPTQANPDFSAAITPPGPTTALALTPPPAAKAASIHRTPHHAKTILGIDIEHSSAPLAFVVAFLIGIVFNAMPCVLPVLPLKIMGFYEVSQHDRKKSVLLGTVFSIGLIASFGVLAILVVGLKTLDWGGLFKLNWFNATISLVLVVMAISTFGFFSVNVPNALYAFTPRHDTYVGNFLFGVLTAALSTPCTFGLFVGLLTWALSQPAWLGVSVIMMVGVGMAAPYFILSAIPEVARNFPRTGPWAEVVKQSMGFLLLATAIYFAQPFFHSFLSSNAFWWTLFAVITAGGIFLIVRSVQLAKTRTPVVVCSILAALIIVPSAFLVIRLTAKPYTWQPYSDQALATARAAGKPVVIDFTADWCGNCHYLEGLVLHDSSVVTAVHDQNAVMLQADVTYSDAPGTPLLNKLNPVGSIPLTAVYLPNTATPQLLDGIYSPDDLVDALTP